MAVIANIPLQQATEDAAPNTGQWSSPATGIFSYCAAYSISSFPNPIITEGDRTGMRSFLLPGFDSFGGVAKIPPIGTGGSWNAAADGLYELPPQWTMEFWFCPSYGDKVFTGGSLVVARYDTTHGTTYGSVFCSAGHTLGGGDIRDMTFWVRALNANYNTTNTVVLSTKGITWAAKEWKKVWLECDRVAEKLRIFIDEVELVSADFTVAVDDDAVIRIGHPTKTAGSLYLMTGMSGAGFSAGARNCLMSDFSLYDTCLSAGSTNTNFLIMFD